MIDRQRVELARARGSAEHRGAGAERPIDTSYDRETRRTFAVRRVPYGDAKRAKVRGHEITRRRRPPVASPDTRGNA